MPFRSEKQRRYLWATNPEIARRWADEYPLNGKKLPMYAKDGPNSDDEKRQQKDADVIKAAKDMLKRIKMPTNTGPTYAGQTDISSEQASTSILDDNTPKPKENADLNKCGTMINARLKQQEENQRAEQEGRLPRHIPAIPGVKRQSVPTPYNPLPMALTQQSANSSTKPAAAQSATPSNDAANRLMKDTITRFGPIAENGNLNGNAAFGVKNSPNSSKTSSHNTTQKSARISAPMCPCGCGEKSYNCTCPKWCSCRNPGMPCAPKKRKTAKPAVSEKKAGVFDFLSRKSPVADASNWNPPAAPDYASFAAEEAAAADQTYIKKMRQYLKQQGYSDIKEHIYEWPTAWSMRGPDKKYYELLLDADVGPPAAPALLKDLYGVERPEEYYRQGPGPVQEPNWEQLNAQSARSKLRTEADVRKYLQNWADKHKKNPSFIDDSWEALEEDLPLRWGPDAFHPDYLIDDLHVDIGNRLRDPKQFGAAVTDLLGKLNLEKQPMLKEKNAGSDNDPQFNLVYPDYKPNYVMPQHLRKNVLKPEEAQSVLRAMREVSPHGALDNTRLDWHGLQIKGYGTRVQNNDKITNLGRWLHHTTGDEFEATHPSKTQGFGDAFLPAANLVSVPSGMGGTLMHELGHAVDYNAFPSQSTPRHLTAAMYRKYAPTLWKEHAAWKKGKKTLLNAFADNKIDPQLTHRVLTNAAGAKRLGLGSYWGGAVGGTVGAGLSAAGLIGLMALARNSGAGNIQIPGRIAALPVVLATMAGVAGGTGLGHLMSRKPVASEKITKAMARALARKQGIPFAEAKRQIEEALNAKKTDDAKPVKKELKKAANASPAWQRSAGKNPEGGLNEKGRKSYERETGGNLKAPVTESNPKGERKARRSSFCARMGGMKKKLTSKATAGDPDSRINKALRKWNCKSGAYKGITEFSGMPGPDQISHAVSQLGMLKALVRPDDSVLKQRGITRSGFQSGLRDIYNHSRNKDRFELSEMAPQPNTHAMLGGLGGVGAAGLLGYAGVRDPAVLAGTAVIPAVAAYFRARNKRHNLLNTAKLVKDYGLLRPKLLRQAYPLLAADD